MHWDHGGFSVSLFLVSLHKYYVVGPFVSVLLFELVPENRLLCQISHR